MSKLRLLLRELLVRSGNDSYIRENFRRIQEYVDSNESGTGTTNVTQNITQITSNTQAAKLVFKKTAGEVLSALRLVRLTSSSTVFLADNTLTFEDSVAVGLTLTNANVGQEVDILTFGISEDPSYSFAVNSPLFLGVSGAITDVVPTTGFSATIGYSLGAGAIFIKIEEPIGL